MEAIDSIANAIPEIKSPKENLSFKTRLAWTIFGVAIFVVMFSLYPYGTYSPQFLSLGIFQHQTMSLAASGFSSILTVSFLIMLIVGGIKLKTNFSKQEEMVMFQRRVKLAVLAVVLIFSLLFAALQAGASSLFPIVALQLIIAGAIVVYLDELLYKYGFTSGINLFILVAFAYQFLLLIAVQTASASACVGSVFTMSCIAQQYISIISIAAVFWLALKVIKRYKRTNDTAQKLSNGIGARMPLNFLSVSFFALYSYSVILNIIRTALNLISASLGSSYLGQFITLYQQSGIGLSYAVGGINYLINAYFPITYSAAIGGLGSYGAYLAYMATHASQLIMPNGSTIFVPEWAHAIIYSIVALVVILISTRVWITAVDRHIAPGERQHTKIIMVQSVALWLLYVVSTTVFSSLIGGITVAFVSYYVYSSVKESRKY